MRQLSPPMVSTTNWRSCCSSAGVICELVAAVMRVLATQVRLCGSRYLTFLQPLLGLGCSTTVRSGMATLVVSG
jgi:hypothetical protein